MNTYHCLISSEVDIDYPKSCSDGGGLYSEQISADEEEIVKKNDSDDSEMVKVLWNKKTQ